MNTYLIPKPITDIVFKYLFGYEKNIKYTYYLLECLYDKEDGYFNNKIKVRNSLKLDKNEIIEKNLETDIVIEYDDKVIINIEAYTKFDNNAIIKSSAYLANLYVSQFEVGDTYSKVKEICQWNIALNSSYKDEEVIILKLNKKEKLLLEESELNYKIVNIKDNKNNNDKLRRLYKFLSSKDMEEAKENAKGDEMLMEMYKSTKNFINNNNEQMKLKDKSNK